MKRKKIELLTESRNYWNWLIGFASLIAVFTLMLTGKAAWRLHNGPENALSPQATETRWGYTEVSALDINAPTRSLNYDSLAPPSGG